MRIQSALLLLRLSLILLQIKFTYQQYKNCDSSCTTCSLNKISECTSCQFSYIFLSQDNKCVQSCPQSTYLDQESKKCVSCSSKHCNQCSQSICTQCSPGYYIDPTNPNNCISNCSESGQILNEQGQCDLSCLYDDQYEANSSTSSCELTKSCSLLIKTPQLQNKLDIASQIYDDISKCLVSIDISGNSVVYSYPDLNVLLGYTLNITSSTIVNCRIIDNDVQQQIITCLQSPLGLIKFYSMNGTIINSTSINDRTFSKSLDSDKDWNLILALKDRYEIYLINYSTFAYIYAENIYQTQLQAMAVQKNLFSFPYDAMALNYTDGTLNYFQAQISSYNKIVSFTSANININSRLIQLKSYNYWILYSNTDFSLLKINTETFIMAIKQTQIIDENLSNIYLTLVQTEILFITGNSKQNSLQFKLFEFDQEKDTLTPKIKEIYNSLLINVNQISIYSNIVITCSAQSINIYQLYQDNSFLKYLTKLREDNPQLCLISNFSVIKQDISIDIWQQIQKNLKVNTFDTITQKYFQSQITNFAETGYSLSKFTYRDYFFGLLVESYENNQLLEVKPYGLIFIYDVIKKNIINQVRVWYPQYEENKITYFNFVQIKDNVYLFAGFERQTFKLKIINIKTFEIQYQQEISEIYFSSFSDLRSVLCPIYFNNTDSMIVPILRFQYVQDIQKRYDFFFIQRNQNTSSQTRYVLISSLQQQARNYMTSISAECLIVFFLTDSVNLIYQAMIFNKNGQKILTTVSYVLRSSTNFGQVNESTRRAYLTSYTSILSINLDTLKVEPTTYSKLWTFSFNKAFNLLYSQDNNVLSNIGEGLYTYNDQPLLKKQALIKNPNYYGYYWHSNDYLIFSSYSTSLVFYDNLNVVIWNLVSIHGNNYGGFIQDKQVVFLNQNAVSHYDISKQTLLYAEDSSIFQQFVLQTQKMRNNYIISENLNIHQVKKYNQILLKRTTDTSNNPLFTQIVVELNYIVSITLTGVRIVDFNSGTLIKLVETDFLIKNIANNINFVNQEIYQRKIQYYQPSNVLLAIYNSTLVCVNMTTLEIGLRVQYTNEFQSFKSTLIDFDLGYFISTNAAEDCFLNLKTLVRKCIKEVDTYQLLPVTAMTFRQYTLELFIEQKTKSLIICQPTSIRMFSLLKFQYLKTYYNTVFGAAQFFYNPNYNYIIYTTTIQFRLFDLTTFTHIQLQNVPTPTKDFQTVNYKLCFLQDKKNYIYLSANYQFVFIFNQQTHALVNTITLDTAPYAFSEWIVDQTNKFIFFIDQKHLLLQISYESYKIMSSYQLLAADASVIQKLMIWDSYKQRLIIASNLQFYVIAISKNMLEMQYPVDIFAGQQVLYIQLALSKNVLFIMNASYYYIFDYDYFINDNKETFPNNINPRYFSVNENTVFFINDINSQLNLFVNGIIKSTWIRNNLQMGYTRIIENDLKNNLVFCIFDNEITILDVSTSEIVQVDQFFNDQNIINILYDDQSNLFLHSQSQQILSLQKKTNKISINEVVKLSQGIALYVFSKNLSQFLFVDYTNQLNINIVNLTLVGDKAVGQQTNNPIVMATNVTHFRMVNDTYMVILLETQLILYSLDQMQIVKTITLPLSHLGGNIRIDRTNLRIFIQNKQTGSLIFDYNLTQKTPQPQINTISNQIQFDENFVYSIVGHSANIFFRKDLYLLVNFRHFNSSLTLKQITYLGIGYFFLVEFITKISVYELSPFQNQPIERAFALSNQYSLIKYNLRKLLSGGSDDSQYQLDLLGFTQEGLFTYSISINLYDQQSKTCSWAYQLSQDTYQELSVVNSLVSYLYLQSQRLNRLIVTLQQNLNLHLPQVSDDYIYPTLEIILKGESQGIQVYVLQPLYQYKSLLNLKLKNMQISVHPDMYNAYIKNNQKLQSLIISKSLYPNLKQLQLENLQIQEAIIDIKEVKQVIIKNMKFLDNKTTISTITQFSISSADYVYIDKIIFEKCNFNVQYPLLKFDNIAKVEINSIQISECQFTGSNQIFIFQNIDNLQIDNLSLTFSNLVLQNFFSLSKSNLILIKTLSLENIQFNQKIRILQSIQQESSQILFDILELQKLNILVLNINQIDSKSPQQLILFQIRYIKTLLEINQSKIMNIKTNQDQKANLFMLLGVIESKFDQLNIFNMNFIQFISLQSYYITESNIFLSKSLSISNASIVKYTIKKQSIIEGQTLSVYLYNISLQNVQLDPDNNTNQLVISVIKLNIQNLKLQNSKFQLINGFYDNTISIKNSISLIIDNSIFSQIKSIESDQYIIAFKKYHTTNLVQENIGIVHFQDCSNIILTKSNFTNNTNNIGSGGSIYSQNSQFIEVDSNIFEQNQSPNGSGGAFYCNVGNFQKFNSNYFSQNSAILGSGGAILLYNCDIQEFMNNFFVKNEAVVGGAIRYKILKPKAFMNKSLSLIKTQNKFIKSKSVVFGQDIGSYPLILDLKNYFEDDVINYNVTLVGISSGYKAKNPLYLRLIDEEMKEVAFINLVSYPKINEELSEELSQYILQAESDSISLLGDLKQGYSNEEFAFKFDLVYSYKPLSTSTIRIKSSQNLYQFVRDQQQAVYQPYEIQITIQFRVCKIGEIISQQGLNTICQICQDGFYSIVDPYESSEVSCIRCPIGSKSCSGFNITLESGYWRLDDFSDIIEHCSNSPNLCEPNPDESNSKFGCIKGYIGPLCEECDVHGQVWGKSYAKFNDYDCRDCSEFSISQNIFIIALIFLFIFSQVYMSVYNKLILTRKYILATYLVQIGMISPDIQRTQTVQTSLMKILLNYIQFLMIVSSLEISLPTYFTLFNLSGGDTSKHTLNRLDCVLFLFETDMPNYIVRIIQINLQPLILFFFIEVFIQFAVSSSQTQAQRETLYTNLIVIFCFYQPSITKVLSQAFSCRKIGDRSYIVSDLTKECLDEEHMFYFFRVLLPLTIFWVILCPLFLFMRMRNYKSQMHEISIMYRYGYLYQEYKHEHYYWDLIRILVRSFAIITINLFNFRVAFKGLVIQGIIIFYLALALKFKPYGLQIFNQLDKQSCYLVILTLYLIIVGYLSENTYLGMASATLVAILNGRFVLMMIQKIFIKPIPYLESKRNVFQHILFALKRRVPNLFKWIIISDVNKIQTFKYWLMIRKEKKRIIALGYRFQMERSQQNLGQFQLMYQQSLTNYGLTQQNNEQSALVSNRNY